MQQSEINLPSVSERRKATLLPQATVAHRGGGISTGATVKHNWRFKDITGQQFSRLRVLKFYGHTKRKHATWECLCECGKICIVSGNLLRLGHSRSCGCLKIESTIARNTKHGMSPRKGWSREYSAWVGMKDRCLNPTNNMFHRYGGRGISICKEWMNSPQTFLRDMGVCPAGYSIDRINNDGNYEPGNCRWATTVQQLNNKSDNHHLTFNSRTQTISEWATEVGLDQKVIWKRLKRGWTIEKALTHPLQVRR